MKPRRVYLYINGILTKPGKSENWNGKATTWTHLHTDDYAEKVEYYAGPISRAFGRGQMRRAEKLTRTIYHYVRSGWEVVLVGHSNGGNVIHNAIPMLTTKMRKAIKHVHLIAPASPADFEVNGLNHLNAPVTVWRAGNDKALKMAKAVGWLVGFGTLGLDGPRNEKVPVKVLDFPTWGHSTFFNDLELDRTMAEITGLTV